MTVSKAVLTLQGARKGLIVNSQNLCAKPRRATVKMDAHNGRLHDSRPLVRASCAQRSRSRNGHSP